jgi:mono/diheme cytochrome c family protein
MNARIKLAALASLMIFTVPAIAQSPGADTYKAKCQGCHGAAGMADTSVGKVLKVVPINDPSVKKMNEPAMIDAVKNGMGKMQAFKGKLTDDQIKGAVEYFRTLGK